ncbi:MAG: nucleotidyltransferase family protein [Candidatus Ornithomonoglobus sp.]
MLTIKQIINAAEIVAKEYPIIKMQLFGSYAEGHSTDKSDVDILIEFNPDVVVTLLTLCKVKNRMEELLNTPVDVISMPIPKDSMLKINKVVSLYAA